MTNRRGTLCGLLTAAALLAWQPIAARGVAPDALPEDVRALLEKIVDIYRRAATYQDDARIEIRMSADDPAEALVFPAAVRFERPNKISFDGGVISIRCDGKKLVRVARSLGKSVEFEAPPVMTPQTMFAAARGELDLFVHLKLLMNDNALEELLQNATAVTLEPEQTIDDRPCQVLHFARPAPMLDAQMFVDQTTHVVHEYRLSAEGKGDELPAGTPQRVSLQLKDVRLNDAVPAEAFGLASVPSPQSEPATRSSGGPQFAVGAPAPPFKLKDLDGRPFKLEDMRGRVVVLDFWATWCTPCLAELPHLQRAYVKYRDKGVVFVGVCADTEASAAKIRDFVDDARVTFRIVLDRSGGVQRLYEVRGVPVTVLIDQRGIVRKFHMGFNPFMKPNPVDVLVSEIDELLKNPH